MTFAEYLIGRSGLPSGTATLMEHLEAIEGTGGGDVIINSQIVEISQNDVILLEQFDDAVSVSQNSSVRIEEADAVVEITQIEDDVVYVVCEV